MPEQRHYRRFSLGLLSASAREFIDRSEFVSLGCHGAVAPSLQALGLTNSAYPFDLLRSSVSGIISCFETDFCSSSPHDDELAPCTSGFGGSFWTDSSSKRDFQRCVDRLLGVGEVPSSKARVFVRAVNSTQEIELSCRLHRAICDALPEAKVHLLVLVDLQTVEGPVRVSCTEDTLLFYQVHETKATKSLSHSEAYAEAIAWAVRFWSDEKVDFTRVESLQHLEAICAPFTGGDATSEPFVPRRLLHQQSRERAKKQLNVLRTVGNVSSTFGRAMHNAVRKPWDRRPWRGREGRGHALHRRRVGHAETCVESCSECTG